MSNTAIRIEGLSKRYEIGEIGAGIGTLRDTISDVISAPFKKLQSFRKPSVPKDKQAIWAVKDINCEIKKGDIVGLIGRNGAGKSTLLKILSRITSPTIGYANVYGRVGSLLEIGTGFHQELTGRENIYLNGSILGMRQAEIHRKFDEIVEFAGTSKFIDTPVKQYSSGMYLRLAFAVAAHLETEILLVDEILSVGDLEFQRKCLGKMEDVASLGRTVLLVSHNLAAIKELCQTSVVMDGGQIVFQGSAVEGLAYYSESMIRGNLLHGDSTIPALNRTAWRNVLLNGHYAGNFPQLSSGQPFFVEGTLDVATDCLGGALIFIIEDSAGSTTVHRRIELKKLQSAGLKKGRYKVRVDVPGLWIAPGLYSIYFKFIGHKHLSDPRQSWEDRTLSERVMVDVIGDGNGISNACLAPAIQWDLSAGAARAPRDEGADLALAKPSQVYE